MMRISLEVDFLPLPLPPGLEPLDENLVQPTPRFQPCSMLNTEPGHNVLGFLPKEL